MIQPWHFSRKVLSLSLGLVCWYMGDWVNANPKTQSSKAPIESAAVLPLPKQTEGGVEMSPILTELPPGLPPLSLDFKVEEIPANDLRQWSIARMPARENRDATAAFWSRVNRSTTHWNVHLDRKTGGVVATDAASEGRQSFPAFEWKLPDLPGAAAKVPIQVWKCHQGWLAQIDDGEKRSQLIWANEEGRQFQTVGAGTNFSCVVSAQETFVFIQRENVIHQLVLERNSARLTPFFEFTKRHQVRAMATLPEGKLAIVTLHQLLCLNVDKTLEILLPSPGWAPFSPNSAVYDEKSQRLFVGMKHFVARCAIEPGKRASVWLRPSGS